MKCRNCGDVVDPERVELGYDYCLKDECQEQCLKRVRLAAVGVNKAADYYTTAEEVLPLSLRRDAAPIEDDAPTEPAVRGRPPTAPKAGESTLQRLRRREAELDAALEVAYERFCRSEITATELDDEREELIKAFNRAVMRENIRYRSMVRSRPGPH